MVIVVCVSLFEEKVSTDIFTNGKFYLCSQLGHFLPDLVHPHDNFLPEKVAVHADHPEAN